MQKKDILYNNNSNVDYFLCAPASLSDLLIWYVNV